MVTVRIEVVFYGPEGLGGAFCLRVWNKPVCSRGRERLRATGTWDLGERVFVLPEMA